jgi:hypothetical protein
MKSLPYMISPWLVLCIEVFETLSCKPINRIAIVRFLGLLLSKRYKHIRAFNGPNSTFQVYQSLIANHPNDLSR